MTQLCRAKCHGCSKTFVTEVPLCPTCQARSLSGHSGGTVAWVAYLITPLPVGPFYSKEARDVFYRDMHRTHPELAGKRVDCFEEIVPDPAPGSVAPGKPS